MTDKPQFSQSVVNDCGGPKFQKEAGCFRTDACIPDRSVAFGETLERHDEYPTAASPANHHSDNAAIPRYPLAEIPETNGSGTNKQTYSMNALEKILRMPLSLFEMADRIRDIPTPRKRFFQLVVAASGLAPNTVKMILCSTRAGIYPGERIRKRIALALKKDVNALFPADRLQAGSIADVYSGLPSKKIDYHRFVCLLSDATHLSRKTVWKWLKIRRVPTNSAKARIAGLIGVSITQLFPPCGEDKNTPK